MENNGIAKLSNELTYQRYLMNRGQVRDFFKKMSIPEYIALHQIEVNSESVDVNSGRTYLKELSEKMQLSIRQTSRMAGELRDRGLILWSHDGNGSEGTYVVITESGRKLLSEQEEIIKDYYGRVIEKYGKDNLVSLLQMMKELEAVMGSTAEEMGVKADVDEEPT